MLIAAIVCVVMGTPPKLSCWSGRGVNIDIARDKPKPKTPTWGPRR